MGPGFLPNPSGLNRSFSLDALVAAYFRVFGQALLGSSTKRMARVDMTFDEIDRPRLPVVRVLTCPWTLSPTRQMVVLKRLVPASLLGVS